jgi:hypothetical protein
MCFHEVEKCCWDKLRLKICFRTIAKVSEYSLITMVGMLSKQTDLDGVRRLWALKLSESEINSENITSQYRKSEAKAPA